MYFGVYGIVHNCAGATNPQQNLFEQKEIAFEGVFALLLSFLENGCSRF